MESTIVLIEFEIMLVGVWLMGRAVGPMLDPGTLTMLMGVRSMGRAEGPMLDPGALNETTCNWDVDFSGVCQRQVARSKHRSVATASKKRKERR